MQTIYFVSHPDVDIDPNVVVTDWSLSARGMSRMRSMLGQSWVNNLQLVYSSTEKKAVDGAQIVAASLNLPFVEIEALGENDRSATGYLPAVEFEKLADQFFSEPNVSVRGWETANDAQARIVDAVKRIEAHETDGSILIVSHGAVGALLYCYLAGFEIDRQYDQPGSGGGNYFAFERHTGKLLHGWKPIDLV